MAGAGRSDLGYKKVGRRRSRVSKVDTNTKAPSRRRERLARLEARVLTSKLLRTLKQVGIWRRRLFGFFVSSSKTISPVSIQQ